MSEIDERRAALRRAIDEDAPLDHITALREDLACILLAEDRPLEAIEELEFAIRARVLDGDPDDPDLLEIQGILGRALTEARRFDEAIAVLTQVVVGRARVLGDDDPRTLVARGNLLRALGRSGQVRAALVMADELIADRRRILGDDHPSTLDARGHRAQLLDLDGRSEQAVGELASLLDDRLRVLGPNHPVVASTRHNLATIRSRARTPSTTDSRWELEQNFAEVAAALGDDHPDALTALGVLAEHLLSIRDDAEAVVLLDRIIAARVRVLGPDAGPTLTSRRMRCLALVRLGELDTAVREASTLVLDARRALGPANYETLLANLQLVECLQAAVESTPDPDDHLVDALDDEILRLTGVDVSRLDRNDRVRWQIEELRRAADAA